ncbi:MAG TPA: hypothetical protein VFS21_20670, partial [Roseiflexaceae bacterium]|nr:hypothetical protein [Roseiflexaceae bacterium]
MTPLFESPLRRTLRLLAPIAAAVVLVALFAPTIYANRCRITPCQPASWDEIYQIIETQTGKTHRVGAIWVRPSPSSTFTSTGPEELQLQVDLVASQPDPREAGAYAFQVFEFDDRQRSIRWSNLRGRVETALSPELQHRLSRVRIGPRDVYRMTMEQARKESGEMFMPHLSSLSLSIDERTREMFGVESVWLTYYPNQSSFVVYVVDAQTG